MKIVKKNTSISIIVDSFSSITSEITFTIESELVDGHELNSLFPFQFNLINGKLIYYGSVNVPNMYDLLNTFKIAQEDIGLSVKQAMDKWLTGIIYNLNLLKINQSDWDVE